MSDDLEPYPEYKDSGVPWLGELPRQWGSAPIRRYSRVFAGATPSRAVPEYWTNGTIPWLSSGDVNHRRIMQASQFITEAGFAASSTKWIRPGSIVVALAGQGRTKGMVATVDCETTCNQSLAAISPSPNTANYQFLAYYLESRYIDIRGLVGDGLRDGLNLEHVKSIPTPLPPIEEHAAIVRFLDHADRRIRRFIAAKRKLIALLNEQKQAIILRAVTRGLDPDVRLKPSGVEWLGGVPEHWKVIRLKHVFREVDARSRSGREVLLSLRMYRGLVPHEEVSEKLIPSEALVGFKKVLPGQVVMNRMRASIGMFAVTPQPGIVSPDYAVFEPTETINPSYYVHLFKTPAICSVFRLESKGLGTGSSGFLRLYTDRFALIKVPMPSPGEQDAIVQYIQESTEGLENSVRIIEREIDLIREYRIRLIVDVVTGKLDVRAAAAQLPEESDEPAAPDEAEVLVEGDELMEETELEAATMEVDA